jgi:predicted  nucleic acid-binding Zn-ribbon protein
MPYFRCLECGAVSYSAARHQAREKCPVCGRSLTEEQDVSEQQVRDYLYSGRPSPSRAAAPEPKKPK